MEYLRVGYLLKRKKKKKKKTQYDKTLKITQKLTQREENKLCYSARSLYTRHTCWATHAHTIYHIISFFFFFFHLLLEFHKGEERLLSLCSSLPTHIFFFHCAIRFNLISFFFSFFFRVASDQYQSQFYFINRHCRIQRLNTRQKHLNPTQSSHLFLFLFELNLYFMKYSPSFQW